MKQKQYNNNMKSSPENKKKYRIELLSQYTGNERKYLDTQSTDMKVDDFIKKLINEIDTYITRNSKQGDISFKKWSKHCSYVIVTQQYSGSGNKKLDKIRRYRIEYDDNGDYQKKDLKRIVIKLCKKSVKYDKKSDNKNIKTEYLKLSELYCTTKEEAAREMNNYFYNIFKVKKLGNIGDDETDKRITADDVDTTKGYNLKIEQYNINDTTPNVDIFEVKDKKTKRKTDKTDEEGKPVYEMKLETKFKKIRSFKARFIKNIEEVEVKKEPSKNNKKRLKENRYLDLSIIKEKYKDQFSQPFGRYINSNPKNAAPKAISSINGKIKTLKKYRKELKDKKLSEKERKKKEDYIEKNKGIFDSISEKDLSNGIYVEVVETSRHQSKSKKKSVNLYYCRRKEQENIKSYSVGQITKDGKKVTQTIEKKFLNEVIPVKDIKSESNTQNKKRSKSKKDDEKKTIEEKTIEEENDSLKKKAKELKRQEKIKSKSKSKSKRKKRKKRESD